MKVVTVETHERGIVAAHAPTTTLEVLVSALQQAGWRDRLGVLGEYASLSKPGSPDITIRIEDAR